MIRPKNKTEYAWTVTAIIILSIFSCSYVRYLNSDRTSVYCRSCSTISGLPDSLEFIFIEDDNFCRLNSSLFEREDLNSLIIVADRIVWPARIADSHIDTLAIYSPEMFEIPDFFNQLNDLDALICFLNGEDIVDSLINSAVFGSMHSLNLGLSNVSHLTKDLLSLENWKVLRVFSKDNELISIDSNLTLSRHLEHLALPVDGGCFSDEIFELTNLKTIQLGSFSGLDKLYTRLSKLNQLTEFCVEDISYKLRSDIEKLLPGVNFRCRGLFLSPESWE